MFDNVYRGFDRAVRALIATLNARWWSNIEVSETYSSFGMGELGARLARKTT